MITIRILRPALTIEGEPKDIQHLLWDIIPTSGVVRNNGYANIVWPPCKGCGHTAQEHNEHYRCLKCNCGEYR